MITKRTGPIDPRIYARIFEEDGDGAAILEELVVIFSKPPRVEGGIDAVLKTYRDAGARMVLEHIVARINQAKGNDPNDDAD